MALIGICGAHRTGKSTLAKKWAERNKFVYQDVNVSGALKEAGFDSSCIQTLPPDEFIQAQTVVLDRIESVCKTLNHVPEEHFVLDRTPIDALGYFRSYFNGADWYLLQNRSREEQAHFNNIYMSYVRRAYEDCRYFMMMVLVQPGIQIVEEDGKALADPCFMNQLNCMMTGDLLAVDELFPDLAPTSYFIERAMIDLEERLDLLDDWFNRTLLYNYAESFKQDVC